MSLTIKSLRVLVCSLTFSLSVSAQIAAQTSIEDSLLEQARPRRTSVSTSTGGSPVLTTDPVIISVAEEIQPLAGTHRKPSILRSLSSATNHIDEMLLAAIDTRIGAPYVWGAAGPRVFDCSGFVWSVFKSAGVNFERTNARSLWLRFAPAQGDERHQFGTLVFFNNLQHVGIVADANGFYHASRSQGVTYSRFDGYWGGRVDGFRNMPASATLAE